MSQILETYLLLNEIKVGSIWNVPEWGDGGLIIEEVGDVVIKFRFLNSNCLRSGFKSNFKLMIKNQNVRLISK